MRLLTSFYPNVLTSFFPNRRVGLLAKMKTDAGKPKADKVDAAAPAAADPAATAPAAAKAQ